MVVLDPEHAPDVMSDADLVADAQRGSTAAFAALYERHHQRILGHCRSRIGGNDAADAAQETFLRAWRALDGFGGEGRVYPWLRTIATNVCIDTLRRRSRSIPVAEVDVAPTEDSTDLGQLAVHTEAMTEALTRLSERHRSVLQLREYEGWTYERIADHEQLDLSAVKSLLWRARQSLRREFLLVSAQGRLSALAGILSLGRLREVLDQVGASSAQLGAGGTVAAATAVAAMVAVPALTAAPAPVPVAPPPVVVVTTVPRPTATIAVPAGRGARPRVLARVAPTTTVPATVAVAAIEEAPTTTPSTSTTTSTVPTEGSRSDTSEHPSSARSGSGSANVAADRPSDPGRDTAKEQAAATKDAAKEKAKEQAAAAKDAAKERAAAAKDAAKEKVAAAKAAAAEAATRTKAAKEHVEAEATTAREAPVKGRSESGRRVTVELTTTTTTAPPPTTTTTTAPPASTTERPDHDRGEGDHGRHHGGGRS